MVAAQQQIFPARAFHVAVRKNGLDPTFAWWRRAYFRFAWKPFLRFSFRVFGVPAPERMNPDGSFTFLEGIGIATTEDIARAMCADKSYRVSPLPLNAALPKESVDAYSQTWPKSDYKPPPYPILAAPLNDLATIKRNLDYVSKAATGKQ